MTAELMAKYAHLKQILLDMGGCLVAFSGGIDSTLLFAVAVETLGDRALAVTATSSTYPQRERDEAREMARHLGGRHHEIVSEELDIPEFRDNPPERCYYCKRELFEKLRQIAHAEGLSCIVDGANCDDRNDVRPGRRAAAEAGVRSPLEEAEFSKNDIRQLARSLGIPIWDKPAFACLSSRFPYGTTITPERLGQVGRAEEALLNLGFRTVRVRYHDTVARLELGPEEFLRASGAQRDQVDELVRAAGFTYVALDLRGYRSGSMNETTKFIPKNSSE